MHHEQVCLISTLCRGIIVASGQKYWFLGACVIYLLFAIPVVLLQLVDRPLFHTPLTPTPNPTVVLHIPRHSPFPLLATQS